MNQLKINGKQTSFPEGLPESLGRLLHKLDIDGATVVAEIDGAIVKCEDFDTTTLVDGQTIELIRFVGGG